MTSIRDAVKRAGVGVGTVSRALNGTGYVAEDTKVRILATAEKLDYQPDGLTRNLFRNRTGTIGTVVPDMESPFFSKLLKHMEIQFYKNGYKVMTCNIIEISNCEQDFADILRQNVMGRVITGVYSLQGHACLNLDKPAVATDRNLGLGISMIHLDHKVGRQMVTWFLPDVGCRNVLNFDGSSRIHAPFNDRHQEFEQVMEENGASVKTIEITWNTTECDYYCRITKQYMGIYRDINRVFTTDIGVPYCFSIVSQKGVKVLEKLHIVGYDTVDIIRSFTPKSINIAQDISGLVTAYVDTTTNLLNSKEVEMGQIPPVSI